MTDTTRMIPRLPAEDAPDVSDASVSVAIMMLALLEREQEQARFHERMADAIEAKDWRTAARLHRGMAGIEPSVARVPRIARAAAARYDSGEAPPLPDPTLDARARRAMLRVAAFTENRLPQYWSPRPKSGPPADPASKRTKACRKRTRELLGLTDRELADIGPAPMEPDASARRLLVAARNRRTAACRACGACSLATAPLMRPLSG